MLSQLGNVLLGHADVVQPLHADLAAGAVAHRLLDVIAGLVAEQAVDPDAELVLGLVTELLLAVQVQLSSQLESLTVTMPPVTVWPLKGSRLQIFLIYWGILSSRVVMVALSQLDSSG